MGPFAKKKKTPRQRRVDTQKRAAREPMSWWRRFAAAGGGRGLLLALGFYLCALLMDVWPANPFLYRQGQYIPRDVHARVGFEVPSAKKTEEAKLEARRTAPPVFVINEGLLNRIVEDLRALPRRIAPASTQPSTRPAKVDTALKEQFNLSAEDLPAWRELHKPEKRAQYEQLIAQLRRRLARTLLVRVTESRRKRFGGEVIVQGPQGRAAHAIDELIPLDRRERVRQVIDGMVEWFAPARRKNVRAYLLRTFSNGQAVYEFDLTATRREQDARVRAIEAAPPADAFVRGDPVVVRAEGEDAEKGLTPTQLELLRAEHAAFVAHRQAEAPWRFWARVAGRGVVVLLVVAALCLYAGRYHDWVVRSFRRGVAVAAVMVLMLAVSKLMIQGFEWNPYAALGPVIFGAVVLTIAHEQRFALAAGTALATLVVLQIRADLLLMIVMLAGLATTVFQLNEVRTRTKLIRVTAVAAAVSFAAVWSEGLAVSWPWEFVLRNGLYAAGAAVLAGFVSQGSLPLVEKVFGVATSLTLLEWCDASRPLLKRLAMLAPGTYNHSLQLGAMCESAADAIGARGLLARVGAYYHDIGKTNKPDYFIENQGAASKHEKLSPAMSLLVIIGHVKDGLEMAREYGLPEELHEFIATHHGTTLVQYFYQQAAEQSRQGAQREPEEVEFRYPGPRPRSKEAAILMLADVSESSVRAMPEPTPGRIETQVHTMVNRRLMDGQLDECELTLKEVQQIERSLVKSLCGIYHARIAYPSAPGEKPAASETPGREGEPKPPESEQAPAGETSEKAEQRR